MIIKLDHADTGISFKIYNLFQQAYQIEADIIGVTNFPPLLRSAKNIRQSSTIFYGMYKDSLLAAVAEVRVADNTLYIDSFVVSPECFRKGVASTLMDYLINQLGCATVIVETAVANEPAINLYKKFGMVEFKRWTPDHGIKKLALAVTAEI